MVKRCGGLTHVVGPVDSGLGDLGVSPGWVTALCAWVRYLRSFL